MRSVWFAAAALGTIALATPALAGPDLVVNGGFETGTLAGWTVGSGTIPYMGCNGTPTVQARGSSPGDGAFRMVVDGASGGSIGLPNVSCVTVSQFIKLDPNSAYSLHFEGTVMQLVLNDALDLVYYPTSSFDQAFNGGLGYSFDATLQPGFCNKPPLFSCNTSIQFAFAVVGTGQDAGFLDSFRLVQSDVILVEPGTLALFAAGVAGLIGSRRRRTVR